ncbi:hypothetical protein ES703_76216 [subsurface metagenome]
MQDIKQTVDEVHETHLDEKVETLRSNIDDISEDVQTWQLPEKDTYLEALESLRGHVGEIESEWGTVSATMKTQRERLESLLESFPGVIETSSIRALALRLTHLEGLVSKLVEEANAKATTSTTRKQLIISLMALGVTVVLWGAFIGLNFFG